MTRKLTSHEFKALEEIYAWDELEPFQKKWSSMESLAALGFVEQYAAVPDRRIVVGFRITDAGRKFVESFPPKDWNAADQ